ncbi:MAG: type III-A CRISPR-associated RAMP protein Csm5 [Nitrospirae bacterium]|nr:MAG: type III-A CRISPR-associated RAMP protein Csm5 [Nitrospirota bacterium]
MERPLKIRLHVLSPIHIGCDDVYEPTSFVIDEQRKKLIEFDPMDFVKRLKPQEFTEFSKTAAGDNLLAIFKMIKRFYSKTLAGREVEITDYLVEHYKKILKMGTFDKNAVINQFTINKTAFNPQDNTPYIPGTSLKGALRTAYLSALANKNKIADWKSKADSLETNLLEREDGKEKMSTDPFRMLKVSDLLPVANVDTKIFYAVNKKKKLSDKASKAETGPPQIFEAIKSESVFEGSINVQIPEKGSNIKNPLKKEDLLKAAQRFYSTIMKDDESLSQIIGLNKLSEHLYYTKFSEQLNKTAFLIRLGRHSGAEAVTIEGNRQIKIIKRPEPLSYATTLWLASDEPKPKSNNNLLPFGWAVLEVLPFDVREGIYTAKKQPAPQPLLQEAKQETTVSAPTKKQAPTIISEPITWENASVVWTPGNQTLKASKDNQKAEMKVPDKSIVPEQYHESLFAKKKSVTANITVEKTGNGFKIIKIH